MIQVLAVLVNFGHEQLHYLQQVVENLKNFEKYKVKVIVNSNIDLKIKGVDVVNVIELDNYHLLPLTCRKTIWVNRNKYDVFLYGENDHLFNETHLDNHIKYSKLLPKNRVPGLIQYEINETGRYYPGYHNNFDWDYNSIEIYNGKIFAHFRNLHQATFILTREQLKKVGERFDFDKLVDDKEYTFQKKVKRKFKKWFGMYVEKPKSYSIKCKVNTDVYKYGGMKKMICISEFNDNLIHHLPNLYIEGLKGRNKFRSDEERMQIALKKMLGNND